MLSSLISYLKYIRLARRFPNSLFYSNVQVDHSSSVGYKSVLFSNSTLISSTLGDYTYVQKFSNIYNAEVGKFCSIAPNVNIGLANHPTNFISTSPIFYDNSQSLPEFFIQNNMQEKVLPRTYIGSDVWIGQSVMIKAGLTIGTGSILGAGAIVTKNVLPYSIVVGVPSKVIKMRFPDDLIVELLASKWWEEDPSLLKTLSSSFNNPNEFLEKLKCLK